ncbi:uncharacterized protein F4822DRAFT_444714 [Hypoxylon trugodes]|uniref:uncharacterized protein n=1 Tax=Hypoxylon trugodes TaxID=326681 RepID=UPI0021925B29|nr:uncharacterized protein F4822DRAFT_444714 [Hypoxylon trugodes]KAI1386290.1 hypothetical protein F4822DRAFT_444714 [Hypoxylon trugodes]
MPNNSQHEQPRRNQEYGGRSYRRPKRQNNRQKQTTTRVRGDIWQSVSALQLGLQPRSFEELHRERMGLLEMLQQHDRRALDLFGRVPVIEEQMQQSETTADERKRAGKNRGWLRHRIVETVEEEKRILARLSELHVEIQCRERWYRVEAEREARRTPVGEVAEENLQQQHQSQQPNTGYNEQPFLPPLQPMPFYNQANTMPYDPYYHSPYYKFSSNDWTYPEHSWGYQAPVYPQDAYRDHYGDEMHGTPLNEESGGSSHSYSDSIQIITESRPTKRNSMPTLNFTWDEGNKEEGDDYT